MTFCHTPHDKLLYLLKKAKGNGWLDQGLPRKRKDQRVSVRLRSWELDGLEKELMGVLKCDRSAAIRWCINHCLIELGSMRRELSHDEITDIYAQAYARAVLGETPSKGKSKEN